MSPDQIRATLRPLLDTIATASEGWTLGICSPDPALCCVMALMIDCCRYSASTIAEFLTLPLAEQGRLLVICSDRCADGGADEVILQLRRALGEERCRFLVILPPDVAQERLEQIWHCGVDALVCSGSWGNGQLLQALLLLMRDQASLDPGLQARLQQPRRAGGALGEALTLTPRERELLLAIARGHNSTAIASLLQMRSDSVRRSLSALYQKVGVRDHRGLIAWGLEQGLIRPPDLHAPPRPLEPVACSNGRRSRAGGHSVVPLAADHRGAAAAAGPVAAAASR